MDYLFKTYGNGYGQMACLGLGDCVQFCSRTYRGNARMAQKFTALGESADVEGYRFPACSLDSDPGAV